MHCNFNGVIFCATLRESSDTRQAPCSHRILLHGILLITAATWNATGELQQRHRAGVKWVICNYRQRCRSTRIFVVLANKNKEAFILHVNDSYFSESKGKSMNCFGRILGLVFGGLLK